MGGRPILPYILIPFAAFATAFCVGAVMALWTAKRTKIVTTKTTAGEDVRIETPLGTIGIHPTATLDPRLAEIPLYPGAESEKPATPASVSVVHFRGRTFEETTASYWSFDPVDAVWDFYHQALPEWPRNLVDARGKELIEHRTDCVRLIRITKVDQRTLIETSIKPPNYPHVFD